MPARQPLSINDIADTRTARISGRFAQPGRSIIGDLPPYGDRVNNIAAASADTSGVSGDHGHKRPLHEVNPPARPTAVVTGRSAVRPALPRQKPSIVLHRSGFGAKMARKNAPKLKRQHKSRSFYAVRVMALVIFLCGIGVSVNAWHINQIVKTQASVLAKTADRNKENNSMELELTASDTASYRVAPELPRILSIPAINVNARVQALGVKPDNELRAPGSIFDTGWYEGSSKPGDSGTVLISGHVSGPTKHGVFYSLANLRENDKIELERGDGRIFHYHVVKMETYDYEEVDIPVLLKSAEPGKPGLNIMSAGGRFDVRTNKFEKQTVVFAVQD